MGWLIDTSIWIAVERGTLGAADIHAVTRQEPVYLSPVNVAEMQFGLEMLRAGPLKNKAAASIRRLRRKPQLRITVETAEVFGALTAHLKKAGRAADFRINDLWLAAQAIQRDFRLLTSNPKDFADIPGLQMVAIPLRGGAGKA
ncbi:MAG: PIN domain-containing protein [Nitrospira sp.]|nr:PIN domain-containing protein [Nitrospira sp.]MCK6556607.1 PIN domain-containing protein [Candidatus Binatia bacterium]